VDVRILFVPGCPNVERTRRRLRQALDELALPASVSETEVATPGEAARARMAGSPTVLIDGQDAFPEGGTESSLACRLYRDGDRVDGAPTVARLVEALRAAEDARLDSVNEHGHLLDGGLDEVEQALAVTGFGALWEQRACPPEELLPDVAAARSAAVALARRGRAQLDDAGAVVGVHGLTLHPTRHQFLHRGQARHTWCAFDSIGIPAALTLDALARTDCPTCQQPLTVAIRDGQPEPGNAVLWLPAPPTDDLMAQFCSSADLYCSPDHLRQRIDAATTPGEIADLGAAAELGRQAWADIIGVPLGLGS
jgi:hypothetical protein